jgi:HD-GYP domain-containing protein (c-di-GMP phosphodiesterase class II)
MASRNFVIPAQIFDESVTHLQGWLDESFEVLHDAFRVKFHMWNTNAEELLRVGGTPGIAMRPHLQQAIETAASGNRPEIVEDEFGLAILAVPVQLSVRDRCIATASFKVADHEDLDLAAFCELLECDLAELQDWYASQETWNVTQLSKFAELVTDGIKANVRTERLESEVEKVSSNLANTYEEICLLHSLTQNLRISRSDEELGRIALDRLLECIPIQGVAIQLLPVADDGDVTYDARTEIAFLTEGEQVIDSETFTRLIEELHLGMGCGPFVANPNVTGQDDWPAANVRQLIIVPLTEGEHLFGWLAAFNHVSDLEFGTVEANLLASIATMLGIHSGNRELYRQQMEFMAAVVRALTSAIDAKDPYTCGHSDRVARVSVRIAQEMGCDQEFLDTIYMAGLLHDTGKIGIDDNVLRKPGRLTDEEFEHIKLHPEIGYSILRDLKQLKDCLPAVLHHHEQWDGGGYPAGLKGNDIPMIARIMAVADAYDAMHSDRPYRKGMPEEKVESILREGAGQQWDQSVVAAYFKARDDIRDISVDERAGLTLDVKKWMEGEEPK